ncbi:hypothetical protein [Fuchsiella alkaliacetigena]|uniref:hypothetical protein n=1 Tax=Fuchsiella alkaliacetigena TaxID=957042 RepID=UPI00200A54FF|nr:hypothetical protein [Fuchsiella alkaliacetigena]MCK8824303.1 hypothetical protein [Fuchsiella alkaliacetigena]
MKIAYYLAKGVKFVFEKKLGQATVLKVNPRQINLYNPKPHSHFKSRCKRIIKESLWTEALKMLLTDKERLLSKLYLIPGDWDLDTIPYREYETYQHMEELYNCNYNYQETERYQELMELIERGETFKHKGPVMKSKEDIEERYFGRYIKTFRSMEEKGYINKRLDDLGYVAISRKGEIVKMQRGRHRLAIAQLVGIESFPVKIKYIHPQWIEKQLEQSSANELSLDFLRESLQRLQEKYKQEELFVEDDKASAKL